MMAMKTELTPQENGILHSVLAEDLEEIVLKTDYRGVITYASTDLAKLGVASAQNETGIGELTTPEHARALETLHTSVVVGQPSSAPVEFPISGSGTGPRWFQLRIRALRDDKGDTYGALCVLRAVDERRRLEEELFAASLTEPLTGLTNRGAFISMLKHMTDQHMGGTLTLIDIDHLRAINLKQGLEAGDAVLRTCAEQLRRLTRPEDILSQIGGGSFTILQPGLTPDEARPACRDLLAALAKSTLQGEAGRFTATASGGIARIGGSHENTIKRAELALFLAKAQGRNRAEIYKGRLFPWSGGAPQPVPLRVA